MTYVICLIDTNRAENDLPSMAVHVSFITLAALARAAASILCLEGMRYRAAGFGESHFCSHVPLIITNIIINLITFYSGQNWPLHKIGGD